MKKELKSGILLADKSADCRPTVGGVNVIAVLPAILQAITTDNSSRVNYKTSNQVKALFNFPVFRAALTDQNMWVPKRTKAGYIF